MKSTHVKTFSEYIAWVRQLNESIHAKNNKSKITILYRGQFGHIRQPKPSVGRGETMAIDELTDTEKESLKEFGRLLYAYRRPPRTRIEMMSIAQHYGLRTRLLDWSSSPLIALYFAVHRRDREDEKPENGVVYALKIPKTNWIHGEEIQDGKNGDPFHDRFDWGEGIVGFAPTAIDRRITAQQSYFTVHEDPRASLIDVALSNGNLAMAITDEISRKNIRQELPKYGITERIVFPEMDGLAQHIDQKHFPDD